MPLSSLGKTTPNLKLPVVGSYSCERSWRSVAMEMDRGVPLGASYITRLAFLAPKSHAQMHARHYMTSMKLYPELSEGLPQNPRTFCAALNDLFDGEGLFFRH